MFLIPPMSTAMSPKRKRVKEVSDKKTSRSNGTVEHNPKNVYDAKKDATWKGTEKTNVFAPIRGGK